VAFDFNVLNVFNQGTPISLFTTRYRTLNTIAGTDIDPNYNQDTQTLIPILNKVLNGQIGTQLSQLENGGLPGLISSIDKSARPNPIEVITGYLLYIRVSVTSDLVCDSSSSRIRIGTCLKPAP